MNIELVNDRECGVENSINTINIILNKNSIFLDVKFVDDIIYKPIFERISFPIEVPIENIIERSEDFGIITLSFSYSFDEFKLFSITPETFMGKKGISDYHVPYQLIPMVVFFTPYKGCQLSDCNILIRKLKNIPVNSNIIFDKKISNLSEFMDFDFPWNEQNYPKIFCQDEAKIGEKIIFSVTSPNNRPVYLESNIGILNKNKISKDSEVELDLTTIQDIDEHVIIKIGYKYWTGIQEKKIKLTN